MPYGKGSGKIFAIATAAAKRAGYSDFSKGSMGYRKRSKIAESIARKHPYGKGIGRRQS